MPYAGNCLMSTHATGPCDEELDDYRWLIGEGAASWLRSAVERIEDIREPAAALTALNNTLRKHLSPQRARLVVEQTTLRYRGRRKFTRAHSMFFTGRGLEQATDEVLARYKATRFPGQVSVSDFCCGIGGDLLALAGRGEVLGVDNDPIVALLAAANVDGLASRASPTEVVCRSVTAVADTLAGPWHIDPDRRPQGHRTTRIEDHRPSLREIETLFQASPDGAVKLAPATTPPPAWQQDAELEWISRNGECKQLVAWFGDLARESGRRVATIVKGAVGAQSYGVRSVVARSGSGQETQAFAKRIGRYLYEPDAAVLAAGLEMTLANELGLAPISSASAYLTGDGELHDEAVPGFEVIEVLPFRKHRLKQFLAQGRYGRLEVKKRGLRLDANRLQRELAVPGDQEATVLVTRVGQRIIAIVAHRIDQHSRDDSPCNAPFGGSPASSDT